ncbi:MAG: gliding motility-associated C-terminal domain-containing protein [Ferruginibacter sp.]
MKITVSSTFLFLFFLAGLNKLNAQVCTGSLGDAVVSINFGAGSGVGPALPASQTTYSYTAGDCPNDGSYTIINSTNNCFSGSWHNLTEDHTPNDVNGYMMLVNASITPSDFYVDTIKALCANTTYEFTAWVVNVLKTSACQPNPTRPNLVFTIETTTGTVLGTYSTGNLIETGSPVWTQYGLFFTTPPGTPNVVIRIRNNGPGGCGNDLALDDIAFRPCGPKVVTSVLNTTITNVDLCTGSSSNTVLTSIVSGGYSNPALQWQLSVDNGATWTDIAGATGNNYTFTATAIGVYKYRLTVAEAGNIANINCRVASNITTITIHDLPVITAGSNSPVCEDKSVNLTAAGGATYNWTGPAGYTANVQNPVFTASNNSAGNYIVTVKDQFGCVNTASTMVSILQKPIMDVFPKSASFCTGDSVLLTATGGISYLWTPAAGLTNPAVASTYAKPATSITYNVTATGANACTSSMDVKITVFKKPVVRAGDDIALINGQSAVINAVLDTTNVNFFWTPVDFLDNPAVVRPLTTPNRDITYTLHAVSGLGCGTATDTVLIKVYNDLYIPNAFTPDGNGKNDRWEIKALAAYPLAKVFVFNRLGELVFASNGATDYWDGTYKGKKAAAGAYVYMIDLKNNSPVIKGQVLLVR